jgi:hypothetical protein
MRFGSLYNSAYTSSDILVLSGTGAATFSSSVTATEGIFISPNNIIGSLIIQGGKDNVTSVGEINSKLDFGSNDASVGVNDGYRVGGRISSVTEFSNGAYVGMAFYTYYQGRTPDLLEAMRITSGGNVGIGTTSPLYKLDVNGITSISTANFSTSAENSSIYFNNTYPSTYALAKIGYGTDGQFYTGYLSFSTTAAANANVLIERMRITSDGNVGIGTTGPFAKLQVESNDYSIISYSTSAFSSAIYGENTNAGVGIEAIANSGTGLIVRSNTGNIASFFGASGGEKVDRKSVV